MRFDFALSVVNPLLDRGSNFGCGQLLRECVKSKCGRTGDRAAAPFRTFDGADVAFDGFSERGATKAQSGANLKDHTTAGRVGRMKFPGFGEFAYFGFFHIIDYSNLGSRKGQRIRPLCVLLRGRLDACA